MKLKFCLCLLQLSLECITATEFGNGDTKEQGNVDELVVPVLCNLAACCVQLKVMKLSSSIQ
jgi:hypothetical protein